MKLVESDVYLTYLKEDYKKKVTKIKLHKKTIRKITKIRKKNI